MARWPIRVAHLSQIPCHFAPIILSISLTSHLSLLPIGRELHTAIWPPRRCQNSTRTWRWGRKAATDQATEISGPDDGWWVPRSPSKVMPQPQFLAIFGAVWPPFTVRPPILEWAFHPLKNRGPLDGRIIAIEKSVTIHTVSAITFSGELRRFREVRPSKV